MERGAVEQLWLVNQGLDCWAETYSQVDTNTLT